MLFHFTRNVCAVFLALLALTGCGPGVGELRESRDPQVRRARDLRSAGQFDAAIRTYNEALDKQGDMPQAHLEVAAIYHQEKRDFISAIYHYQRFLDLSPSSQKTNLVAAEIRRAKMEYAASLPDRPSDAVQTIATMTTERDLLSNRVKELQAQVDQLKYAVAVASAATVRAQAQVAQGGAQRVAPQQQGSHNIGVAPMPSPSATNAAEAQRTYVVKPGDTLAKIAREFYRNPEMSHAIFAANKATMKNERDLRAGQKIFLPAGARADGG